MAIEALRVDQIAEQVTLLAIRNPSTLSGVLDRLANQSGAQLLLGTIADRPCDRRGRDALDRHAFLRRHIGVVNSDPRRRRARKSVGTAIWIAAGFTSERSSSPSTVSPHRKPTVLNGHRAACMYGVHRPSGIRRSPDRLQEAVRLSRDRVNRVVRDVSRHGKSP